MVKLLAPTLSTLSDLSADGTYYAETTSFAESSCSDDDSSYTDDDDDEDTVYSSEYNAIVVGSTNMVHGTTSMSPPRTLTTRTTAATTFWFLEERRFQLCFDCFAEANFWDEEDSFRDDGNETFSNVTTTTTTTKTTSAAAAATTAPWALTLTGRPMMYANPPAFNNNHLLSKPCHVKVNGNDSEPKARQTWGVAMI